MSSLSRVARTEAALCALLTAALGAVALGCNPAGVRVVLDDEAYPAEAEWEELPEHVREEFRAMSEAAEPEQRLDRPPYPVGGMAAIMRRLTYPELARRAGIEGSVIVHAIVDESGNVASAHVEQGVGGGLDEEAIAAVQAMPFRPGIRDGTPVEAEVCVPINFRLR